MDNLVKLLIDHGLADDEEWAKAFIKHGLITLNGKVVTEEKIDIPIGGVISKIGFILKVGKRRFLKVLCTDVE